MRGVLLSVWLAVLALPTAALAHGIPLGPVDGSVSADGQRWVAWAADSRTTRILDARDGSLADVATPDGCARVSAVGGGQLLWTCPAPGFSVPYPLLLDLTSGLIHRPAGTSSFVKTDGNGGCDSLTFLAIGRAWLSAECGYYHGPSVQYLNWHTGKLDFTNPAPVDRHHQADLDSPALQTPLCSPIARPQSPNYDGFDGAADTQWTVMDYDRPWALAPPGLGGKRFALHRCGAHRPARTYRCETACANVTLAGRIISWSDGSRARWAHVDASARTIGASRHLQGLVHAGHLLVGWRAGPPSQVVVWRLPGAPAVAVAR